LEIRKLFPDIEVTGEACPIWVPLVETNEYDSEGADYFVRRHVERLLERDPEIDTIILGCTHYPILLEKIRKYTPDNVRLITQGAAVASSLKSYLNNHPQLEALCTKGGTTQFCTTEADGKFGDQASLFLNHPIDVKTVTLI
jgi:glutamate racemase